MRTKRNTTNDDTKLRSSLLRMAKDLYRLHDLQQHGLNAIPECYEDDSISHSLRADVQTLLCDLQEVGLFLVPVGELESWVPALMKGISREDKSRWAMLAAEKIEDAGERKNDVWSFIRAVSDFLNSRLEQIAKG